MEQMKPRALSGEASSATKPPEAKAEVNDTNAVGTQTEHQMASRSSNADTSTGKPSRFTFRVFVPFLVLLMAAAILLFTSSSWNSWGSAQDSQITDDAYLRADITPLSTKVSDTVTRVAVEDYQHVKAGDLLVQLKDSDYRAQVGQAEAGVRGAQAAF